MKLTESQIETKAKQLSTDHDCEVPPIVIDANGEQIIGYFLEPSSNIVLFAMDAYYAGNLSEIAEAVIKDCLIEEESSPRINSDKRKDSKVKFSFANACMKLITPFVDEYKKKALPLGNKSGAAILKGQKR